MAKRADGGLNVKDFKVFLKMMLSILEIVVVSSIILVILFSTALFIDDMVTKSEEHKTDVVAEEIIVSTPEIKTEIETPTEPEKEKQIFLLTAYCPCVKCSGSYGDITATGKRAVEGRTIAVDPNVIAYGTTVHIDGIGTRIAEDCGGLVKGNHIDIYFDCHSKAKAFGKRYAEVEI